MDVADIISGDGDFSFAELIPVFVGIGGGILFFYFFFISEIADWVFVLLDSFTILRIDILYI